MRILNPDCDKVSYMKSNQKIMLTVSIVSIITCIISFVLQLTDSDFLSAVVFLLMALYCTMNAAKIIKKVNR